MDRIINYMPNSDTYSAEIADKLCNLLKKDGFVPYHGYNPDAELNIAIGGDGAFLQAVRTSDFSEIPFIGINTGTLGFFPEITPENIEFFIKQYKNNNFFINDISIIECHVNSISGKEIIYAVNDIAIKRGDMKAAHLHMFFNGNYLQTISGDGVIVSSPLGSSAYNYSVGGALVYPSLKTLQIAPIAPLISNAYRCLKSSLIIPPEAKIKITPERKSNYIISLVADGIVYNYTSIDSMEFQTSSRTIKQLTIGSYNYWNVIKDKLL